MDNKASQLSLDLSDVDNRIVWDHKYFSSSSIFRWSVVLASCYTSRNVRTRLNKISGSDSLVLPAPTEDRGGRDVRRRTLIRLLITPGRVDATDAGQRVSPAGNLSWDICNTGRLLLLLTPNNKDTVRPHLLAVTRDLQTELVPTNHFKLQKYWQVRFSNLVIVFGQVTQSLSHSLTHSQSSKCLVTKRKGKHPPQFSVGRQYYSQIQSTYPDCSFCHQHLPCLFMMRQTIPLSFEIKGSIISFLNLFLYLVKPCKVSKHKYY